MNNKILKIALGLSLTVGALTASAQKNYTEGVINYTVTTAAGDVDYNVAFRGDSTATTFQGGPATIKLITTAKHTYFAIAVDVPIASMKKAAVLTPDELDQAAEETPKFTFNQTTETKQINGYNCKKVTGKDPKSGAEFELWITNDVSAPGNTLTSALAAAGGFPVKFSTSIQGQKSDVVLKSITAQKIPAGTFSIGKDYDKITYQELMSMRQ